MSGSALSPATWASSWSFDQVSLRETRHRPSGRFQPAALKLEPKILAQFPEGYRHLAYLQSSLGFKVKLDLPGLKGPDADALYAKGKKWLSGEGL